MLLLKLLLRFILVYYINTHVTKIYATGKHLSEWRDKQVHGREQPKLAYHENIK